MRNIIRRNRLLACFLVCLSFNPSILSFFANNLITPFTLSDEKGPEFRDVTDVFIDAIPESDINHFTLELYVLVFDVDGISTVIGSYREQNETEWNNSTLTLNHVFETDWQSYIGNATDFTLSREYPTRVWEVRYYACDSMGNWNSTDIVQYSYNLLPPQNNPIGSIAVYGVLFLIIMASIVGIAYWKKH